MNSFPSLSYNKISQVTMLSNKIQERVVGEFSIPRWVIIYYVLFPFFSSVWPIVKSSKMSVTWLRKFGIQSHHLRKNCPGIEIAVDFTLVKIYFFDKLKNLLSWYQISEISVYQSRMLCSLQIIQKSILWNVIHL